MLENNGADAVAFTSSELTELTAQVSAIQIQGARLPQGVLHFQTLKRLRNYETWTALPMA
jgi:hypothetical protein